LKSSDFISVEHSAQFRTERASTVTVVKLMSTELTSGSAVSRETNFEHCSQRFPIVLVQVFVSASACREAEQSDDGYWPSDGHHPKEQRTHGHRKHFQ
jgi:hypothetical protein